MYIVTITYAEQDCVDSAVTHYLTFTHKVKKFDIFTFILREFQCNGSKIFAFNVIRVEE